MLCGAHHRAVHLGTLVIRGSASTGLSFSHADGTPYGGPLEPSAIDMAARAFGALCKLGFPQLRARALVDKVLALGRPASLSELIRAALQAA